MARRKRLSYLKGVKVLAMGLIGSGWLVMMIGVMAMCRVASTGDVALDTNQAMPDPARTRAWVARGQDAHPAPGAFKATGGRPPSSVRG
jgi:hypothetical protein